MKPSRRYALLICHHILQAVLEKFPCVASSLFCQFVELVCLWRVVECNTPLARLLFLISLLKCRREMNDIKTFRPNYCSLYWISALVVDFLALHPTIPEESS